MLTATDALVWHAAQDVGLVILSIICLPLTTPIIALLWVYSRYARPSHIACSGRPRTVLVTGVGMTKGLALARMFHQSGHRVLGADFEQGLATSAGRVSNSISRFFPLRKPSQDQGAQKYIQDLLNIIRSQNVDLWVSCSGVASAVEDGQAKEQIERHTSCKAIQFNVADTEMLHEKHNFIQRTSQLGLNVPETVLVKSQKEAQDKLTSHANGKRYIVKCVGLDDSSRGNMTLLPLKSKDQTQSYLANLDISAENPWIIQQYIQGNEYCTHALVIQGEVKAFVACPSLELLMHYDALPAGSPLSTAMLRFTKTFAAQSGPDFTGHLSFDFLVEDDSCTTPDQVVLFPIECNPRAHTAVVLFSDSPSMIDAYTDIFTADGAARTTTNAGPVVPLSPQKYYWIGHDLAYEVLIPLWQAATLSSSMGDLKTHLQTFLSHVLFWRDGTFSAMDPLPWWWLYHVYWPMTFLQALLSRKKWSRINVSTTKMFMC